MPYSRQRYFMEEKEFEKLLLQEEQRQQAAKQRGFQVRKRTTPKEKERVCRMQKDGKKESICRHLQNI